MFSIERRQQILELLKEQKTVSVSDLSKRFFIGEATIRRDLCTFEALGLAKRTYGGAILLEGLDSEIPLIVRETEQRDKKQRIAKTAADMVQDGDVITMDSSSTALHMVPYLRRKTNLTVITNGAKTALDCGTLPRTKVVCTGGRLRENSLSYIGNLAQRCIRDFVSGTLFFSCRSISSDIGITDVNEEESVLRRDMIRHSRRVVLLCDSTKFDANSFAYICSFSDIHCLITDAEPSPMLQEALAHSGVQLVVAR